MHRWLAVAPRTTIATLVALVLSVLPAFMLGGVAVLMRAELGLSEAGLGLALSAFPDDPDERRIVATTGRCDGAGTAKQEAT